MSNIDKIDHGQSLIAELEEAIQSGSKDKRVDTLRRITDLFIADANRLNDQQIEVFDDILGHLITRIESKALAELSRRLGPINNAPVDVVQRLARDDNIAVAEPVLSQSARLSDTDLIEIAQTKTQAHLLAISGRSLIATGVTDVLLQHGDQKVFHKLAGNSGANFSENGFATLVSRSEQDEHLATKVGLRLDIPMHMFRQLLLRATEAVRARLLAAAGPESRNQIQRVLAAISEDARRDAGLESEPDYTEAHARAVAMQKKGELDEKAVLEFAKSGRYADLVAAIAVLGETPLPLLQNLLQKEHREAILLPCKAAGLDWLTVREIMAGRGVGRTMPDADIEAARVDYHKLSVNNARRVIRFWQVRQTASNNTTAAAGPSPPLAPGLNTRALVDS